MRRLAVILCSEFCYAGFRQDEIEVSVNEAGTEICISGGGDRSSFDAVISGRVRLSNQVETRPFRRVFRIPSGVALDLIEASFDEDEATLIILMPKCARGDVSGIAIEEIEGEEKEEVTVVEEVKEENEIPLGQSIEVDDNGEEETENIQIVPATPGKEEESSTTTANEEIEQEKDGEIEEEEEEEVPGVEEVKEENEIPLGQPNKVDDNGEGETENLQILPATPGKEEESSTTPANEEIEQEKDGEIVGEEEEEEVPGIEEVKEENEIPLGQPNEVDDNVEEETENIQIKPAIPRKEEEISTTKATEEIEQEKDEEIEGKEEGKEITLGQPKEVDENGEEETEKTQVVPAIARNEEVSSTTEATEEIKQEKDDEVSTKEETVEKLDQNDHESSEIELLDKSEATTDQGGGDDNGDTEKKDYGTETETPREEIEEVQYLDSGGKPPPAATPAPIDGAEREEELEKPSHLQLQQDEKAPPPIEADVPDTKPRQPEEQQREDDRTPDPASRRSKDEETEGQYNFAPKLGESIETLDGYRTEDHIKDSKEEEVLKNEESPGQVDKEKKSRRESGGGEGEGGRAPVSRRLEQTSLVASSAFILSLAAVALHLLKNRNRMRQQS